MEKCYSYNSFNIDTHRKLYNNAFIGILQSLQFSKIDNTNICCGVDVYAFLKYLYEENASTYVRVFGYLAYMEAHLKLIEIMPVGPISILLCSHIKKRDLWLTM